MNNINPKQFFNNFFNNFGAQNNIQRAPIEQTNQSPMQQLNQSQTQAPYIAQPYLPKTAQQLINTTAELTLLNQQQNMNMLKDLLKFPKNFEQLLEQISTMPNDANKKNVLLLLTSTLDTAQLSTLLQNSSKEAMTNLYKMLAQFNQTGMSMKDEQTNELIKLISFVAASSSSDIQSIRTTMLMYLPWLPLTDPDTFKLEISNKNGSNDSALNDDYISLLIETENYGNLQADVYKTNEDGIKIQLISSQTFPQKDFILLMKEESKKYSININLDMAQKESFNKDKNEKSKIQVCMNISPGVNPFLLLISNSVIKNIHIIDEKENLREQRKEKLDNGKS